MKKVITDILKEKELTLLKYSNQIKGRLTRVVRVEYQDKNEFFTYFEDGYEPGNPFSERETVKRFKKHIELFTFAAVINIDNAIDNVAPIQQHYGHYDFITR